MLIGGQRRGTGRGGVVAGRLAAGAGEGHVRAIYRRSELSPDALAGNALRLFEVRRVTARLVPRAARTRMGT